MSTTRQGCPLRAAAAERERRRLHPAPPTTPRTRSRATTAGSSPGSSREPRRAAAPVARPRRPLLGRGAPPPRHPERRAAWTSARARHARHDEEAQAAPATSRSRGCLHPPHRAGGARGGAPRGLPRRSAKETAVRVGRCEPGVPAPVEPSLQERLRVRHRAAHAAVSSGADRRASPGRRARRSAENLESGARAPASSLPATRATTGAASRPAPPRRRSDGAAEGASASRSLAQAASTRAGRGEGSPDAGTGPWKRTPRAVEAGRGGARPRARGRPHDSTRCAGRLQEAQGDISVRRSASGRIVAQERRGAPQERGPRTRPARGSSSRPEAAGGPHPCPAARPGGGEALGSEQALHAAEGNAARSRATGRRPARRRPTPRPVPVRQARASRSPHDELPRRLSR